MVDREKRTSSMAFILKGQTWGRKHGDGHDYMHIAYVAP